MAYVLTYDSLTTAVEHYLERINAALVSDIPLFIMLGERRVARDLKILGLKVFVSGTLLIDNPVLVKPTRWLNTSSFNIGIGTGNHQKKNILQRSYEYAIIYWPDATLVAQPKYISDRLYDDFWITPTPDQAYPYEFAYYQTPQLIDETVSTNFLTTNAPDILIYATLLETAVYLKDDERVAVWLQYYNVAKAALTEEDMRRIYDGFSKRGG